jgi:hypothetical protein
MHHVLGEELGLRSVQNDVFEREQGGIKDGGVEVCGLEVLKPRLV